MDKNEICNLLAYSEIVEEQFKSARKSKLWVAALTLGCSLAECQLLVRAISSIEQVRGLPKHESITIEKLCGKSWGLLKLSKLALNLGWFDAKHVDKFVADTLIGEICKKVPQVQSLRFKHAVPVLLLQLVRIQRNTIHPGKVAVLDRVPKRKDFLEDAEGHCVLLDIVLRCLRESQNDPALARNVGGLSRAYLFNLNSKI
jgi:hypothetical protein